MKALKSTTRLGAASLVAAAIATMFAAAPVQAQRPGAPPAPSPCHTTGPIKVGVPSPNSYSFTTGTTGSVNGSVVLTAPDVQVTGACDPSLTPTFGQTSDTLLTVSMTISGVTQNGTAVDAGTAAAVIASFSFSNTVTLAPGQSGTINFSVTNGSAPVGDYDVTFHTGNNSTVADGTNDFGPLSVTAPTALDTAAPTVTIQSPTGNPKILLNGTMSLTFTAVDPVEGGAGTGVASVDANVSDGTNTWSINNLVAASPGLPQPAGSTVSVSGSGVVSQVGSFTLNANATDAATPTPHTGSASAPFTVGVNAICLPPISISGRQFNANSTVPVKWTFTDASGSPVPPFASVAAQIYVANSTAVPVTTAVAGDGAANIRWELDANGNVTSYVVNYPIPVSGVTYTADLFVAGLYQGSCTFTSAAKGGKVK